MMIKCENEIEKRGENCLIVTLDLISGANVMSTQAN